MKNGLILGSSLFLLALPAGAQEDDAPQQPADLAPASESAAPTVSPADSVQAEMLRLQARLGQLEAQAEASRPAPAAKARQRVFGFGLSGGGGVQGEALIGATTPAGDPVTGSGAVGQLPALEARVFAPSGVSVDFSLPLGDILSRLGQRRGFLFESDVYLNFNSQVSTGLHLMIGPGLGFNVGQITVLLPSEFYLGGVNSVRRSTYWVSAPAVSGGGRLSVQAGAEFVIANGLLGIALMARPHVGFQYVSKTTFPLLDSEIGFSTQPGTFVVGGLMGVARISLYTSR